MLPKTRRKTWKVTLTALVPSSATCLVEAETEQEAVGKAVAAARAREIVWRVHGHPTNEVVDARAEET